LEELQVKPITTYLQQYEAQWKSHIERMTHQVAKINNIVQTTSEEITGKTAKTLL
jgi:hypothetical protein